MEGKGRRREIYKNEEGKEKERDYKEMEDGGREKNLLLFILLSLLTFPLPCHLITARWRKREGWSKEGKERGEKEGIGEDTIRKGRKEKENVIMEEKVGGEKEEKYRKRQKRERIKKESKIEENMNTKREKEEGIEPATGLFSKLRTYFWIQGKRKGRREGVREMEEGREGGW